MAKELTALKVRGNLGEILEEVYYKGEEYIIKRGKKPMAVLIPLDEFESLKKQRAADMKVFDKIRAKAKSYSAKEIEVDIEEAIKAVRKSA
ncbi:MAG: type II toxin-antitoxin system Phd/YefM family antitoxin [Nitrospirae bacterium]|nr:type II toxin-antitoxin system Phd/YefM family antitoxin [Nitrospirota bacterium]